MLNTAVQLEASRRSMLRYRFYMDADSLNGIRDSLAKATELLRQATAVTASPDQLRALASLQDGLRSYSGLADKAVELQIEIATQRKALFTQGDELTAATDRLVQNTVSSDDIAVSIATAAAEKAVLLVQVANWRFLATLDPKGPATFKTNREKAEAALASLEAMLDEEPRKFLSTVRAVLNAYTSSFNRISEASLALNTVFDNDIVPTIVGMQKQLETMRLASVANFVESRQASDTTIASATLLQSVLTGVALLLGVALAIIIGRGIVNPLARITMTMTKLSRGDTSVVVPSRDGRDEIGDIARAVEVFKENMVNTASLAATQTREHAAKAARQATVDGHISSFDHSVRDLLSTLAASATDMRTAARSMSATADQTNQQASTVSVAAGQASANVQTMAAATEEMASSAAEIARQVARSTSIASRAVEAARNTDRQVQGLAETAQKIEAVVAIINGIASQTNLLALNATIEAARAGDAGKGFAVVASEVKALAGQTGKATEEIGAQIQAIQAATQSAVDAIKGIGVTIDEINDISTGIAAAMEEQGATTREMTRSTHQAAQGTQEVSTTIQGVSHGASATGAAADQVVSAASELGAKAAALQTEVGSFLDRIRAA